MTTTGNAKDEVPALCRMLPGPVRRAAKRLLLPPLLRALEPHLSGLAGRAERPAGASGTVASGHHIPVAPGGAAGGGAGAYLLPKIDPGTARWSDGLPAPPRRLWHGYAPTIDQVMGIGEQNVRRMLEILREAGCEPRPGSRVLDFGCAAGFMTRQLRHLAEDVAGEAGGEVWGVDLSGPHIDWCMRHLSPPFRFALTSSFPSLPFEDGRFDLAYGGSVFSHIGEHCDGWLLELARVLKPGGTLYLTLVTKEAMWKYIERWPQLGFSKDIQRLFTPEQLRSDFATLVFRNGPGLHTVYDMDYFRAKCEGSFEVLRVQPDVYTFQWAVALRKRSRVARSAAPEVRTRPVGVSAPA